MSRVAVGVTKQGPDCKDLFLSNGSLATDTTKPPHMLGLFVETFCVARVFIRVAILCFEAFHWPQAQRTGVIRTQVLVPLSHLIAVLEHKLQVETVVMPDTRPVGVVLGVIFYFDKQVVDLILLSWRTRGKEAVRCHV